MDKPRLERAARGMLLAIEEDPDREGLSDTPRRIVESYEFLFSGLREDPAEHLQSGISRRVPGDGAYEGHSLSTRSASITSCR